MATLSTTYYGWQPGMAMPTNDLNITTATLGAWQDQAAAQQNYQYQYYVQVPTWTNTVTNAVRKIKFWRLNKVVEMDEGASFQDPLDEVRLKVARWLRPKEAYNFA